MHEFKFALQQTNYVMKFHQLLNLPFDYFQNKKEKWLYIISCSVFFLLFLLVYQPFGLSAQMESGERSIMELLAFVVLLSVLVFTVLYVSQFILRKRFSSAKNDLRNFLKWFLIDIALIVLLNTILDAIFDGDDYNTLNGLLDELVFDVIIIYMALVFVLLYPVLGSTAYVLLRRLHKDKQKLETDLDLVTTHYKIASGNEDLLKIVDEKGDCKLTVPINHLYSIESKNQYVSVTYKRNDQLIEQTIRTRFSKVLDELGDIPSIFKCHRSYAINLLNVQELTNVNQKPNVVLDETKAIKIPVSKTYLKDIKLQLSKF